MSLDDTTSALLRYSDVQQHSITGPPLSIRISETTQATATVTLASPKQLQELHVAAVTAASRAAVLQEDLGALQADLQAERERALALESKCTALTTQLVSNTKYSTQYLYLLHSH